ncbi:hypothetical protein AAFM46_10995 [Arthrobacter sp. TMP15]|uniref:hypothetical protein n=1 Tax=Arthrobacter sp. TMP15 TaxID=3140789 RepID=UPI0031BB2D4C
MAEMEISRELMLKAMHHRDVKAHLQVIADRRKKRVEQLAKAEGVEMTVTTVAGVRPGGRPFVNIVSDNVDQEFGTSRTARRRILGRAAAG